MLHDNELDRSIESGLIKLSLKLLKVLLFLIVTGTLIYLGFK